MSLKRWHESNWNFLSAGQKWSELKRITKIRFLILKFDPAWYLPLKNKRTRIALAKRYSICQILNCKITKSANEKYERAKFCSIMFCRASRDWSFLARCSLNFYSSWDLIRLVLSGDSGDEIWVIANPETSLQETPLSLHFDWTLRLVLVLSVQSLVNTN